MMRGMHGACALLAEWWRIKVKMLKAESVQLLVGVSQARVIQIPGAPVMCSTVQLQLTKPNRQPDHN